MKQVFIRTQNVTRYWSAIRSMEDVESGTPGIALCWGQAGRGKTFAAENYYSENGGIYLNVWEDWTQTAFLQALCFEVRGERPRSSNACKLKVIEALDRMPRTIFVDEADRLHIKRVEDLRDIHRETGVSIVLIGEEELLGLLSERRRIWSRVTQEVQFGPVSEEDVAVYAFDAADLDVQAAACALIVRHSDGDFRLVRNMVQLLEQAARAKETGLVDESLVKAVLKQRSWRRA